ncbi:MAG TPA: hypothetical protein DET40_24580 [Lentisphaeria bacterium]|nr:MAG: hypothetical protein A2X45_22915 [Lentisphaerae bacterium GWF2_50_93]HCE46736.1 hypothetical protein [Lentisphaeria bacterium]
MNKKIMSAVAGIGIFTLMGILYAEEAAKTDTQENKIVAQAECPIMGNKINKSLFVDAQGKRIYVCCGMCIGKLKADPEKYIKELEAKGILLDKAATGTPKTEKKQAATDSPVPMQQVRDGHLPYLSIV